MVYKTQNYWVFEFCPSSIKNLKFLEYWTTDKVQSYEDKLEKQIQCISLEGSLFHSLRASVTDSEECVNIKLSLCLINYAPHHEGMGGSRDIILCILDLSTRQG
jgi:hypothetical protein